MQSPPFQQYLNYQSLGDTIVRGYHSLIRTRQKVYALSAESLLRRKGRAPRFPIEFTSQIGEDLFAWDLFGEQTEGFYVEAGAFDGYHFSVTYPFEAVGWTGLLVEPHPDAFQVCAARRPNSRLVNAVLGAETGAGDVEFFMSADLYGGMKSQISPPGGMPATTPTTGTARIPATTLNEALSFHNGRIDLMVLDVEGAEFAALDGFDIDRYQPRLIIVETAQRDALCERMSRHSYVHIANIEMNTVFLRSDQKEMFERLRWLLL